MRILPLISLALLAGCAKSTKEITPQYVSPLQYNGYKCEQIEAEMMAVSRRAAEVGGQVDKTASDDNAQMAVGLILFWPTLFFLDGDTPQANEYSRLRGEFEALERASIQKSCNIQVKPIPVIKQDEPLENKKGYPDVKQ